MNEYELAHVMKLHGLFTRTWAACGPRASKDRHTWIMKTLVLEDGIEGWVGDGRDYTALIDRGEVANY